MVNRFLGGDRKRIYMGTWWSGRENPHWLGPVTNGDNGKEEKRGRAIEAMHLMLSSIILLLYRGRGNQTQVWFFFLFFGWECLRNSYENGNYSYRIE